MLSKEQLDQIDAAIYSVEKELEISVDRLLAFDIISHIYDIRHGETGDEFRELFDVAIEHHRVGKSERRRYELVCGRYFQPRALAALANSRPKSDEEPKAPVVGIPNAYEVKLVERTGRIITFRALKKDGHLKWLEVKDCGYPPWVLTGELAALHKQALATMNDHRSRKAKRERRKAAQVA